VADLMSARNMSQLSDGHCCQKWHRFWMHFYAIKEIANPRYVKRNEIDWRWLADDANTLSDSCKDDDGSLEFRVSKCYNLVCL
jgi:hypothetical protein